MKNYADVATLSYEQARDELINIVRSLESGSAPLEETLELFERGEALAQRCQQVLQSAQQRLAAVNQPSSANKTKVAPTPEY